MQIISMVFFLFNVVETSHPAAKSAEGMMAAKACWAGLETLPRQADPRSCWHNFWFALYGRLICEELRCSRFAR